MLKTSGVHDERYMLLQTMYEDERQRVADLQSKLNDSNRKLIEYEYQTSSGFVSLSPSYTSLSMLSSLDINNTTDENSSKKSQFTIIKQMEERIKNLIGENIHLKESVEKERKIKLREIQETEVKYRGYLEKAKFVIKSLDPTNLNLETNGADLAGGGGEAASAVASAAVSELELLKNQLVEKDNKIKLLQVSFLIGRSVAIFLKSCWLKSVFYYMSNHNFLFFLDH